eukprot:2824729-Pyramimonas_sp.AAC.1
MGDGNGHGQDEKNTRTRHRTPTPASSAGSASHGAVRDYREASVRPTTPRRTHRTGLLRQPQRACLPLVRSVPT